MMKILVYSCNIYICLSMEFNHEQYNVNWCHKCETQLRLLFLHVFNLFLGQEYLYMDSQHSTAIHISSVVVNDQTVDMCTMYPFTYHMLCHKYDAHVVSHYFNMFHICDVIFHQIFWFEHFSFYLWVFQIPITPV